MRVKHAIFFFCENVFVDIAGHFTAARIRLTTLTVDFCLSI
jgi:hypothetical protein